MLAAGAAQAGDTKWKAVDPENVLVVDTAKGRIFVELHPEMAPKAVERIKLLTRRGTYDGLQFWRVAPNFVVQIDVGNVEGGKTELPNLPPEFRFRLKVDAPHTVIAKPKGLESGFIGAMPYIAVEKNSWGTPKAADGSRSAWISYCTGVVGMGRDAERDSANAELFFMTGVYPGIDREYTPVGRVVVGQDILAGLPQGEPPAAPDVIRTVRVLADVKDNGRLEVEDTAGTGFAEKVAVIRAERGADFSACDVPVAGRVAS
ncbi:peptidyl-prolyl cis-trans isomerase cyclophilin type [Asticcacaulis biprosthecium C19]|uniref:peptidylprolyl isomerase n=1 Tax=Asticcacaulis biprosthecium C19 TaxID=715226 RepID=F4QNM5_9CAUL|nr:peptidylprolyl isomerase [Asticcacaulis biprosthecium]EGF90933.1 peptidyl-prolyl cis-trans isomerase cyclophilin type [Asticcacaulis biprosthecium C19]